MNNLFQMLVPKTAANLWSLFTTLGFWVLILAGISLAVIYYIKSTREIHRLQADLAEIDRMETDDFEEFVKSLLQAEGYSAVPKDPAGDGIDLLVTDWRGSRTAVQARRFGGKERVNKESVRNLLETKRRHGYDRALIVTNSKLTHWADEYARANSVETWDREVLRGLLGKGWATRSQEVIRGNLFKQTEYHKKRGR